MQFFNLKKHKKDAHRIPFFKKIAKKIIEIVPFHVQKTKLILFLCHNLTFAQNQLSGHKICVKPGARSHENSIR